MTLENLEKLLMLQNTKLWDYKKVKSSHKWLNLMRFADIVKNNLDSFEKDNKNILDGLYTGITK